MRTTLRARGSRFEWREDHVAHLPNYFKNARAGQATPQCNDCHTTAPDNRLMLTKSFAANCAACHLDAIIKPGAKGIAVLAIPGLDKKSLDAKTAGIGQWPGDADGEITPFMRQLLAADAKTAAALATLKDADLTNLSTAKPETLAAAEQLAWAVKELIADLISTGHAVLQKRLGTSASPAALGQLPSESMQAFTQPGWWPDLLTEVAAHRAGLPPTKPVPPVPKAGVSSPASSATAPVATTAKPAATDDILGDDILTAPAKPATPPPAPAKPAVADDILGGDDILSGPTPAAPAKPATPAAPKAPTPVAPEKWAAGGGWQVSSADYTLRYKPAGHGDAFLQAWLDLTAQAATENNTTARTIFDQISSASTCLKCHSVDATPAKSAPTAALLVNWHANTPAPQTHSFTKFSHGTHFSLLDEKGCQTCHQLAPAASGTNSSYTAAFKDNHDTAKFISSFQPLKQATCAQCHVERAAGTSCLLCHNYHVGDIAVAKVRTGLTH